MSVGPKEPAKAAIKGKELTRGLYVTLETTDQIIRDLAEAIQADVVQDFQEGKTPEENIEYPDMSMTSNPATRRRFEALRARVIEIAHGTLDSY
jgi:hypothetical protein